jgi:hypothetical protein
VNNQETYSGFPEIRKDLTYDLIVPTLKLYEEWSKLYAGLPNVKVILDPEAEMK